MTQKVTIPVWVNWLAQDADGAWWGFEAEPHQHHTGWYENEIGRYIRLESGLVNPAWQDTLQKLNKR